MTRPEDIFQHSSTSGWIVVVSEAPRLGGAFPHLPERLLEKMDISRPTVCLAAGDSLTPELNAFLEDVEALLGNPASLWQLMEEPPSEMASAGLMVLVGGVVEDWVSGLDNTLVGEVVLQCLGRGGVIFAIGDSAAALGTWFLPSGEDEIREGLNWLTGALVLPNEPEPAELDAVRGLLAGQPKAYALGLAGGSLVAFGPQGQTEVWGETQPRLILGGGWAEA